MRWKVGSPDSLLLSRKTSFCSLGVAGEGAAAGSFFFFPRAEAGSVAGVGADVVVEGVVSRKAVGAPRFQRSTTLEGSGAGSAAAGFGAGAGAWGVGEPGGRGMGSIPPIGSSLQAEVRQRAVSRPTRRRFKGGGSWCGCDELQGRSVQHSTVVRVWPEADGWVDGVRPPEGGARRRARACPSRRFPGPRRGEGTTPGRHGPARPPPAGAYRGRESRRPDPPGRRNAGRRRAGSAREGPIPPRAVPGPAGPPRARPLPRARTGRRPPGARSARRCD